VADTNRPGITYEVGPPNPDDYNNRTVTLTNPAGRIDSIKIPSVWSEERIHNAFTGRSEDFEDLSIAGDALTAMERGDERGFWRRAFWPQIRATVPADLQGLLLGELPQIIRMIPNPLKVPGLGRRSDVPGPSYGERVAPGEEWVATHGMEAARQQWEGYARHADKWLKERNLFSPFEYIGTDMTPETKGEWERLLTMMVEFGGGGPQAKLVTEGLGAISDVNKIALRLAKSSFDELGSAAVTPENARNILEKARGFYRGTATDPWRGGRRVLGETGWGVGAAATFWGGEKLAEGLGASEGGQQAAALAGVILGPPTIRTAFKSLGMLPFGIGKALRAPKERLIDPVVRPENVTRRFASKLFDTEPTARGARRKIARVRNILSAAISEGKHWMDKVSGLVFTSDELAFSEASLLRMRQEEVLERLDNLEYYGLEPETMRPRPDEPFDPALEGLSPEGAAEILLGKRRAEKAQLQKELAQLKEDEMSMLHFGHFQSQVYRAASGDSTIETASKRYAHEVYRWQERTDAFFNQIKNQFNKNADEINFGGAPDPTGLGVRRVLDDDYINAKKGEIPQYESTRTRLVKEGYAEGIEPSELLFIEEDVLKQMDEGLDEASESAARTYLEDSLASADRRAVDWNKRVESWMKEKGYGDWDEVPVSDQRMVGKVIRGIYSDTKREWAATNDAIWKRVEGREIPSTDDIVFPKDSVDINGNPIEGKTVEEVATALLADRTKAQKWNPRQTPGIAAQSMGYSSLVQAAKAVEEKELASAVGTARPATGTISRLEGAKINADKRLNEADEALQKQMELDAAELPKIHDALNTYLSSLDTAYKGSHPHAPAILRHFLNDQTINWEAFTNKKTGPALVRAYLAALPEKVAAEFGLKHGREKVNFTTASRKRLEEIIGADKVKEISAGTTTIYDVLGPTLAAMQGGGKEKIKILQKPFQVAVDFMAQIKEIAPGGNVSGVKTQKLWDKWELANTRAKGAEADLRDAIEAIYGKLQDPETLAELTIDPQGRFSGPTSLQDVQDSVSELFNLADRTNDPILARHALEWRDMLEQLMSADTFPQANAAQLRTAKEISRTGFRVDEAMGDVLEKRPEAIPEAVVAETVLPPVGTGKGFVPGVQRAAIDVIRTVTARLPEEIVTYKQLPDGRVVATFNEDALRPLELENRSIFDHPDYPFAIKKTGKYQTDWEVEVKPGFDTSDLGLDMIEDIVLEQLYLNFPNPDEITTTGIDVFNKQWRNALRTLEKGGRTGPKSVVGLTRDVEKLASELKVAEDLLGTQSKRKVQTLIDQGILTNQFEADEYVNWLADSRIKAADSRTLRDVLKAEPGQAVHKLVKSILKSDNPNAEIGEVLSVIRDNPAALRGFKASLFDSLWRHSTVVDPKVQIGAGSLGKGTVFSPSRFKELMAPKSNFRKLLNETYKNADGTSSNPELIPGLERMAAAAVETAEMVKGGKALPLTDFFQDEVYTNLGRILGLGIAKRAHFVNELYAAGAGGRIFRLLGKHFTGNTVKDMVLGMSLDPRIAVDFLKDVGESEFLLPMLRRYIVDDVLLGVPLRFSKTPGAATQVFTEPVEEASPPPPPAMGPQSSIMPPPNINVASTLNRVRPLAPAQGGAPVPPQFAAAGPPPPGRREMLQGMDDMGLELFTANKGGLASLQKKPRQMVH